MLACYNGTVNFTMGVINLRDIRAEKFAQILVDYSTQVKPGDRVGIASATIEAEPVIRALYQLILERGAYPHLLLELPGQKELLLTYASDKQLDFTPQLHKFVFEEFEVLIKIRSEANTRELSGFDPERVRRYEQGQLAPLIETQMRRGADKSLHWMSTQYPTNAYAMEAEMGFEEYQDFFFRACHADPETPDPVAYWRDVEKKQNHILERLQGHDRFVLRGPNVDLSISVQGRTFINACGKTNMPDGEIFTGPVEDSANGWVRYTYPAIYQGNLVEGVELTFEEGKVVKATAAKNEALLLKMLDSDPGARYLGEFAIGLNYEIDRFTRSILFDEKIGGSFHMALGAGYPETGSHNRSHIHWDMICDLRQESEILLDNELIYRNGQFLT